jgi:hypothetical protein
MAARKHHKKKKSTIKAAAKRRIKCAWKAAKRRGKGVKKLRKSDFKRC